VRASFREGRGIPTRLPMPVTLRLAAAIR